MPVLAIAADLDIVTVVERSAFLHERVGSRFDSSSGAGCTAQAAERLDRWKQRVADGDDARFLRHLDWSGLTLNQARDLVAGVRLNRKDDLPPWATLLATTLPQAATFASMSLEDMEEAICFLNPSDPYPFEHILATFVHCATERVRSASPGGLRLLRDQALIDLQRSLLNALCTLAQEVLGIEFDIKRTVAEPLTQRDTLRTGRRLYRRFVADMLDGGLASTLNYYPVLARMLGERTDFWVAFTSQFLAHLETDIDAVVNVLFDGRKTGQLVRVQPGLSDPHEMGRTVIRLEFEHGLSCIYKPRNLDGERAFNSFLHSLNAIDSAVDLEGYRGVYRANHGWVEAVPVQPCRTDEEVSSFFERSGMLLCILYLLEATDCHSYNIIARGAHPTLIDMETLLQPTLPLSQLGETDADVDLPFGSSVLRVGMLPRWIGSASGDCSNLGALSKSIQDDGVPPGLAWTNINSDRMAPVLRVPQRRRRLSEPGYRSQAVNASLYVDRLVHGFDRMYRTCKAHAALLTNADGPLRSLEEVWPRFVFRNTGTYWRILQNSRKPQYLRDGIDLSIETAVLYWRFAFERSRPAVWTVVEAEQRALLRGDIPRFLFDAEESSLTVQRGEAAISSVALRSGWEQARLNLAELTDHERDVQAAFIRLSFSFDASADGDAASGPPVAGVSPETAPSAPDASQRDELLSQAAAIAASIERSSVKTPDGSPLWLTRAWQPTSDRWETQPMSPRLYDGFTGTGLFLAALARAGGGSQVSELARSTFAPLLDRESLSSRLLCELDLGAGTGLGSVIYGLSRAGLLLGDERLLSRAMELARDLNPSRIQGDRHLDIMRGSAGCLLALLSLNSVTPSDVVLERADQCGQHLLSRRTSTASGLPVWQTLRSQVSIGFSHGLSGIAYALQKLASAVRRPEYEWAASDALVHVDAHYSAAHKNWPAIVTRDVSREPSQNAWCHGAAGIVLGRAGVSAESRDGVIGEAAGALACTSLTGLDHACCGNVGRIEALSYTGQAWRNYDLTNKATELASKVIERAAASGTYNLGSPKSFRAAAFYQGLAGIGYQWLRLAEPDLLPCALLFE